MSTPLALFVVGAPGIGKTTLVRALMARLDPRETRYLVYPKWTVAPGVFAAAGHYDGGTFDGADTVPYNGVEAALDFWSNQLADDCPLTILDGDRFSHEGVVRYFDRSSVRGQYRNGPDVGVAIALLSAPDSLCQARRDARGSKQNASWVAGRVTKARRFAEGFASPASPTIKVDASLPTLAMLADLLDALSQRGYSLEAT